MKVASIEKSGFFNQNLWSGVTPTLVEYFVGPPLIDLILAVFHNIRQADSPDIMLPEVKPFLRMHTKTGLKSTLTIVAYNLQILQGDQLLPLSSTPSVSPDVRYIFGPSNGGKTTPKAILRTALQNLPLWMLNIGVCVVVEYLPFVASLIRLKVEP